MIIFFSIAVGLFLSFANGANDNFKGVATLYGSGTLNYRQALLWATISQVAGSITAIFFAGGLLAAFSGKGLVPDSVAHLTNFHLAVGLAAALTVVLATSLGFPISTTHALLGGLVGAGLMASSSGVDYSKLGTAFVSPLLLSPLMAFALASGLYFVLRALRPKLGISKETCVCVGTEVISVVPAGMSPEAALTQFQATLPTISMNTEAVCKERYDGNVLGIQTKTVIDGFHLFSGGVVCFARGLNDTPKIAAIFMVAGVAFASATVTWVILAVTLTMALGGWLKSRAVAETVAHKVTSMNEGQGFSANLVTGLLVIFASKLGLPVSTTHVSVGSICGIGTVSGQAHPRTIFSILLAWVITLPVAAGLASALYFILSHFASKA